MIVLVPLILLGHWWEHQCVCFNASPPESCWHPNIYLCRNPACAGFNPVAISPDPMQTPAHLGTEHSRPDPKLAMQQMFLCRRSFQPSRDVWHLEVVRMQELNCWAIHHCRAHHPFCSPCQHLSVPIIPWRVTWASAEPGRVSSLREMFKTHSKAYTKSHRTPQWS